MKTKMLLAFLLVGMSCESNDINNLSVLTELKSDNGLNYNQSLEKWTDLKTLNGTSYIYQTTFTSWSGYGSMTELKIEEGVITSRIYEEYQRENGTKTIVDSYAENIGNLGSHEKGAALKTIDDLYETCAKKYLVVNKQKNTIHFQTGEGGLMTICGFVPDGCMDDCYQGIRISSFIWLN